MLTINKSKCRQTSLKSPTRGMWFFLVIPITAPVFDITTDDKDKDKWNQPLWLSNMNSKTNELHWQTTKGYEHFIWHWRAKMGLSWTSFDLKGLQAQNKNRAVIFIYIQYMQMGLTWTSFDLKGQDGPHLDIIWPQGPRWASLRHH